MTEADVIQPSASIASTGKGIRYIGNYAYAYTGPIAASTTDVTVLDFTTGSGLIFGEFQLNGALSGAAPSTNEQTTGTIYFNDIMVTRMSSGNSAIDSPMSQRQKLIIPPFTTVLVTFDMEGVTAGVFATGVFIGRVYGAE